MGRTLRMQLPHWLPAFVEQKIGETYQDYEDRLWNIFYTDFIKTHPTYAGKKVLAQYRPVEADGKWGSFIHITTVKDRRTNERVPDLERCERIRFPKATLENCKHCTICGYTNCERPYIWTETVRTGKHKSERTHILIPSDKYTVIIEFDNKRDCYWLVTAYQLNHEKSYQSELKRYNNAKRLGKVIQ